MYLAFVIVSYKSDADLSVTAQNAGWGFSWPTISFHFYKVKINVTHKMYHKSYIRNNSDASDGLPLLGS